MLAPGDAFIRKGHIWLILSKVTANGFAVCVNLTTLDNECPDDECILQPADYSWITHATAVAFSRAQFYEVEKIELAIQKGLMVQPAEGPVSSQTLEKIREAGRTARELKKDFRDLL